MKSEVGIDKQSFEVVHSSPYCPKKRSSNLYSINGLVSNEKKKKKKAMLRVKKIASKEFNCSFAFSQNSDAKLLNRQIKPKAFSLQWSFFTKLSIKRKKAKDNASYDQSLMTPKSNNRNASSSSSFKSHPRKYYYTKRPFNNQTLNEANAVTSKRHHINNRSLSSQRLTGKGTSTRLNSSFSNENRKEAYIKNQKASLLKGLTISSLSSSSPYLKTFNSDKWAPVIYINDGNIQLVNAVNTKDQCSLQKEECDISLINKCEGTIETGNNNTINRSIHSHLSKANLNSVNSVKPKHENTSVDQVNQSTISIKAKTISYEAEFPKLAQFNTKSQSISPNKQLMSFLFNKKEGRINQLKPLTLIATPSKRDEKRCKKLQSCFAFSSITQFTYQKEPQKQSTIACHQSQTGIKPMADEEFHQENISIVNKDQPKEEESNMASLLSLNELSSGDFIKENSQHDSLNTDSINDVNGERVPHFNSKQKSSPSLKRFIPPITIEEPLAKISQAEPNGCNPNLNPVNVEQPLKTTSQKQKGYTIEQLLIELKQNNKEQFKVISSYDLTSSSPQQVSYLFHLNNNSLLHIKRLLSVESIIPKGNLHRFTILKKNSTLEDILLNELFQIQRKKEQADNVNLIIELLGNNSLLLAELLKD